MMNFQTGVGGWAIKILLALLIVSFAIWGIEDMLFKKARHVDIATIGSVKITTQGLEQAVRREEENLRQSLGNQYSAELMRNLNLHGQVLDKLVNRNLIQQETYALGLMPSDADVVAQIQQNPAFLNASKKFDKEQFAAVLRRNNLSEKDYIEQLRQSMANGLLTESIGRITVSDSEVLALYRALEESRGIKLYTLSPASVTISAPDDDQMEAYHRDHSGEFSLPEYRSASYVIINAEEVKKKLDLNEGDLMTAYQDRIEEFKRSERRSVQQLLFENEEAADKAAELLGKGRSVDQVAKEAGAKGGKPIQMGLIEESKMIAEAASEVFGLESGKFTQPIKSAFGWHVFYVSAIEPPTTLAFEEVKKLLETDAKHLAADRALTKLSNQVEDALASGSSLSDVAKDMGLVVKTIAAVDKSGKNLAGQKAGDIPDLDQFLDVVFATDEKTESTLKPSKGGNYFIVRTETVIPERVQPLADVKLRVAEAVKKQMVAKKMADIANEISNGFADASNRAALISKYQLRESTVSSIKRTDEKQTLPDALITELFDKKPDESTSMVPSGSGEYVLAVLKTITESTATPSANEFAELKRSIEQSTTNEMLSQYLDYLKKKYDVTIDEAALASLAKEPQ